MEEDIEWQPLVSTDMCTYKCTCMGTHQYAHLHAQYMHIQSQNLVVNENLPPTELVLKIQKKKKNTERRSLLALHLHPTTLPF